jgi:hypothetical protein
MASTSAPPAISASQWQSLLGESLSEQHLNWLNGRLKITAVQPGKTFWDSHSGNAGLHIILAGKVRLFDQNGQKLAVLEAAPDPHRQSSLNQRSAACLPWSGRSPPPTSPASGKNFRPFKIISAATVSSFHPTKSP